MAKLYRAFLFLFLGSSSTVIDGFSNESTTIRHRPNANRSTPSSHSSITTRTPPLAATTTVPNDGPDDPSPSSSPPPKAPEEQARWESLNALTLATNDMSKSVSFYETLGLTLTFGGIDSPFATLAPDGATHGTSASLYVNLFASDDYSPPVKEGGRWVGSWGRCVVHVSDVDGLYGKVVEGGVTPEFAPRDADWGERYFHVRDPMGHEISFAKRIDGHPRWKEKVKG